MSKAPQWAIDIVCETFGCYNPSAHADDIKMLLKGAAWQREQDGKALEALCRKHYEDGRPGWAETLKLAQRMQFGESNQVCPECKGDGAIGVNGVDEPCLSCHGKGRVPPNQESNDEQA